MGEAKRKQIQSFQRDLETMVVDTPGGRIHVQWDHSATATPNAQLAFFAEFLQTTGLFKSWVDSCPLNYTSPNAPTKSDVLGTWLLGILAGHNRYSHITGLRGDMVSPQILGMNKIISEDAMRRALSRLSAEDSQAWLEPHLKKSTTVALGTPWILDIDTTIKPLYGKQSGAELGYNPHKPGRPSHALHTYWVANLRLVLDVVVTAGNEHSALSARPGLMQVLRGLEQAQLPRLVRGDCGFGNEPFIRELEEMGQAYLFKLKRTQGVKTLLNRLLKKEGWISPGPQDQGWSVIEDKLQLGGWEKERRVIVLKRPAKESIAISVKRQAKGKKGAEPMQDVLFPDEKVQPWEYAVMVTNSDFPVESIGQLYRDRADAENGFDELKNQWGWGGFTTQDIERCQTSARGVALIYNWWSWFCRAANPKARMEAITSRPLLLAGVGRATKHAGKTTLYLTPMHAAKDKVIAMVDNIRRALAHSRHVAEQLAQTSPWQAFVDYVVARITKKLPPWLINDRLEFAG